jgi:hypothetical protein
LVRQSFGGGYSFAAQGIYPLAKAASLQPFWDLYSLRGNSKCFLDDPKAAVICSLLLFKLYSLRRFGRA